MKMKEWKAELDGAVQFDLDEQVTKEEADRSLMNKQLNEMMQILEREERIAVIQYYISVAALSLIMLGLGVMIGGILL